jgi:acetyl-CoA acetyltransferase
VNRDGFRAGRATAEHEAAHAVIAVLNGRVVHRASIAPSRAERTDWHGLVEHFAPEESPVPLPETGEIDASAAGLVWELLGTRKQVSDQQLAGTRWRQRRRAWQNARADRRQHLVLPFLAAALRVQSTLRRPEVAAAVEAVADAIQSRKSGEIHGTTVEKIVLLHVPALTRQHDRNGLWVGGLAAATVPAAMSSTAGLTADGAR